MSSSKFTFDPLGDTKTSKRFATSFNVIYNGVDGGLNFGFVRKSAAGWVGIYAFTKVSEPLPSKNAVADWMLVQYMTSQEVDIAS
jgi:hypothetical protein